MFTHTKCINKWMNVGFFFYISTFLERLSLNKLTNTAPFPSLFTLRLLYFSNQSVYFPNYCVSFLLECHLWTQGHVLSQGCVRGA